MIGAAEVPSPGAVPGPRPGAVPGPRRPVAVPGPPPVAVPDPRHRPGPVACGLRLRAAATGPVARGLAGAGVLAALAAHLGTGAVREGLAAIDGAAVLAALGIGLLTTVAVAARWCLVARGLGMRTPLPVAVADGYRAALLNTVLPAGVLGDLHRGVRHGRRAGDVGRGVRAVAAERLAGLVVLGAVAAAVLAAQPALLAAAWAAAAGAAPVGPGAAAGGPVVAGVAGALGFAGLAGAALAVRGGPVRRAPRARALLRGWAAEARAGVLAPGTWPGVVLLSAVAVAGHLALFVVAARTAGVAAGLGDLLPPLVLALLAMALPLGVGGFGPREAVAAAAFGAVGLGASAGLAVAVVYGVLALVACLPGIAVLATGRGAR